MFIGLGRIKPVHRATGNKALADDTESFLATRTVFPIFP
jgi:hypothetical protein